MTTNETLLPGLATYIAVARSKVCGLCVDLLSSAFLYFCMQEENGILNLRIPSSRAEGDYFGKTLILKSLLFNASI
jgi:hypothetical protein